MVVEKPFGRDLTSAQSLNRTIHGVFEESSVFRVDPYRGKETVENVLYFRFTNAFLEPTGNGNYVDSMQITLAEAFGVEGAAGSTTRSGAIRDVLQIGMLQVVGMLGMEPPAGYAGGRWISPAPVGRAPAEAGPAHSWRTAYSWLPRRSRPRPDV